MKNTGHEFMVRHVTIAMSRDPTPQQSGTVPQPPLELPLPEGATLIPLVPHEQIAVRPMDVRTAVEERRSLRKYADTPFTLAELSYLLWVSQGVKHVSSRPSTARNVPSAGARHAFETYVLVNRVEGLEPGLYRYMAIEQGLIRIPAPDDIAQQLTHAC